MQDINSDFQLLLALNSIHVELISIGVINQLKLMNDDCLLSGDDSGLKNVWEEICVQLQGDESIYWGVYEGVIRNLISDAINKQPTSVQILLSYIGSFESDINFGSDEDCYTFIRENAVKEVLEDILMTAGYYENENISRFLEGDFTDEEDEEDEGDEEDEEDEGEENDEEDEDDEENEDDDEEEGTESRKFIDEVDVTTSNKITAYINQHYSSYIKGHRIQYGRASFSIEMLTSGSLETWKRNPDMELSSVVDYMFNYFCT